MSKINQTPAKIISRKNIKSFDQKIGFSGSRSSTTDGGVSVAVNEIISVDAAENDNNLDLNGVETIDGYTTGDNDIILVNAQTTSGENDIYVTASSGDWLKITNDLINVDLIKVNNGSNYKNSLWTIESGTSRTDENLSFIQYFGGENLIRLVYEVTPADLLTSATTPITILPPAGVGFAYDVVNLFFIAKFNSLRHTGTSYLNIKANSGTVLIASINPSLISTNADISAKISIYQQMSSTQFVRMDENYQLEYSTTSPYSLGDTTIKLIFLLRKQDLNV